MLSASPRSICAPAEPAAPKARRQNCRRAEAVLALLRISSRAKSRSSGFGSSSSTSSPLTMAPTGLIRSWQTREHNSAASSRESGRGPDGVPDMRFSQQFAVALQRATNSSESRWSFGLDTLRRSELPPATATCEQGRALLRERLFEIRPAFPRLGQIMLGMCGEGIAMGLDPEQIEPLARDHEETGIAGKRHAAGDVDRVIAAELGAIDLRVGHEGGAVALIVEAPDGAGLGGLEIGQAQDSLVLRKIGDGVEPLDGDPRETVHHHPFGRRGPDGDGVADGPDAGQAHENKADRGDLAAQTVAFLPLNR